jgi:hypothetical protein
MNPLNVYELTNPNSHRTSSITAIVVSIFTSLSVQYARPFPCAQSTLASALASMGDFPVQRVGSFEAPVGDELTNWQFLPLLPVPCFPSNNAKQRMRLRFHDTSKLPAHFGRPDPQLGLKVPPLVKQLPSGFSHLCRAALSQNLRGIKAITSSLRLPREASQKHRHRSQRITLRLKACQLGMIPVTLSRPSKHLLREERLSPRRHQPFRVQIPRVHRP